MVYTVTCNPSLDYTVDVDDLRLGEINRTKKEQIFAGGKGNNVSMVLKNLGMDTTALGFVAGFTGDEIIRMLDEKGIRTDYIHVAEGFTSINVKIRSVPETAINGMGPAVTEEDAGELMRQLESLGADDVLILSGNIPPCLPQSLYRDIVAELQGKGVKIVVDAEGDSLADVLEYGPFLIKPNHEELSGIIGRSVTTRDEAVEGAKLLQERGARNVLVSMAGEGAVLVAENGEVFKGESPKGKLVNSVGAGDSMVAGFVYGYLTTGSYREAFRYGVCTGSASAFSETLATAGEVQALLDTYETE